MADQFRSALVIGRLSRCLVRRGCSCCCLRRSLAWVDPMNFGLFMSIFILLAARWRLITNYPGAVLTACLPHARSINVQPHTNVLSREIREAKFETSLPRGYGYGARAKKPRYKKNWVQGERRTSTGRARQRQRQPVQPGFCLENGEWSG